MAFVGANTAPDRESTLSILALAALVLALVALLRTGKGGYLAVPVKHLEEELAQVRATSCSICAPFRQLRDPVARTPAGRARRAAPPGSTNACSRSPSGARSCSRCWSSVRSPYAWCGVRSERISGAALPAALRGHAVLLTTNEANTAALVLYGSQGLRAESARRERGVEHIGCETESEEDQEGSDVAMPREPQQDRRTHGPKAAEQVRRVQPLLTQVHRRAGGGAERVATYSGRPGATWRQLRRGAAPPFWAGSPAGMSDC